MLSAFFCGGHDTFLNVVKPHDIRHGGSMSFGDVPDLSGLPDIHMEVKRVERLNISAAMAQAVRDAFRFQDGAPTVFHRRSREPWLVTQRLEDWLKIYQKGGKA